MTNMHSLKDARRTKTNAQRMLREQITRELAELVNVPAPTSEELRRMEQEIPEAVLADDPPFGNRTPPKLLAQYYLWQTLDELRYNLTNPEYRARGSYPPRVNRMREFLERYKRFAGPALKEELQYYL